jgi:two-component system nitrogen regulation response regulator GlnG
VLSRDEVIDGDAVRAVRGHPRVGEPAGAGFAEAVRALVDRLATDHPAVLADGTLYDRVIAQVERPLIEVMLLRHGGNQLRAARALGLNRNTLKKRIDSLGLAVRADEAG